MTGVVTANYTVFLNKPVSTALDQGSSMYHASVLNLRVCRTLDRREDFGESCGREVRQGESRDGNVPGEIDGPK